MRLVTPFERVLIALGPSRNVALLELDEPVSSAAAMAQVMAWVDAWPRFGMFFHEFGPWYRADEASVDPVRHVIVVDAGDTPVETLLTAALTGTLDPEIPPWQVVLINPADGGGNGPCRIIVHFDHVIADGVRFVNLLSAARHHDRQPATFADTAKRLQRLSLDAFLSGPRDPRVVVPDVAALTTEVHNNQSDDDKGTARLTRRLTLAMTRAVAQVADDRRLNRRCAAVTMIGRRQASKANAVTAVEVDSAADGDRPREEFACRRAGQPVVAAAVVHADGTDRHVGLPGKAGALAHCQDGDAMGWASDSGALWPSAAAFRRPRDRGNLVPHGPGGAGSTDPHRRRLSRPVPPLGGNGVPLARQGRSLRRGTER